MNLGMLLSWEQIYLLKVKDKSFFHNEEEMIQYLKEENGFSQYQIDIAYGFYKFATASFKEQEWQEVDELFTILEQGRKVNIDEAMSTIGKVLWEMGKLFGTNLDDTHYH